MKQNILTTHQKQLRPLIKQYGITYLALFGSQARGDMNAHSDIDLLYDYEKPLGMFRLIDLQNELQSLLQQKVDLVSKRGVSKYLRGYIKNDLQVFYEKK